jgi:hypothetical protein
VKTVAKDANNVIFFINFFILLYLKLKAYEI